MSHNYNNITTKTEKIIKGSKIVSLLKEVTSADNKQLPSTPMRQKDQVVNEGKLRPNNHISEGYLGEKKQGRAEGDRNEYQQTENKETQQKVITIVL